MAKNHINISCLLLQFPIHDLVIFLRRLSVMWTRLQRIMHHYDEDGFFKGGNQGKLLAS